MQRPDLADPHFQALFSLIGTYYGGNGTTNFQLPNLQGNVPMHWGNGTGRNPYGFGETDGTTTVIGRTSNCRFTTT